MKGNQRKIDFSRGKRKKERERKKGRENVKIYYEYFIFI